jgi:HK97 family phage major capsid protein
MTEVTTDPAVRTQAEAMAEALIPQLDSRIAARLAAQAETQEQQFKELLAGYGLLDEHGEPKPPPVDPIATALAQSRPFARLGDQLQAIVRAASPSGGVDPRLGQIMAATGMSEGVPGDGGFLLQDTYVNDIFRRVNETGQVFSRITRRYPLSGNSNSIKLPGIDETSRADGSRWGGVQAYWVAEGGSVTATKPTFSRIALELNKLMATSYATNEQLSDTPIIEGLVQEGFAEEMGFKLDDAAIRGTGVGEPLGILNATAKVEVAKETGQAADTIVYENVLKMWARLWARSRSNAVWFINQDIEPQLATMSVAVGTGGVPVYLPATGASQSGYSTLFGRPVVPIEQCSTLGDAGDIILADMSQYWAIDKGGVNQASSMHVQFLTDETAFRATYRADYTPMWTSALTPFKGSNTLSPFITLAARA